MRGSIFIGVLLILAGAAAIAFPFFSTIAMKILLGWIFLIAGAAQIFNVFACKGWGGVLWHLLVAAVFIIAGAWLAFYPLAGILPLTIFLAIVFVAEGVFETIMSLRARPQPGWMLVLFSGLVAIAVGILIAMQLPSSAVWAIGVLAGINLIVSGVSYIGIAMSSGKSA